MKRVLRILPFAAMSEAGVFVSEVRQWFIRLVGSLHLAARYVCTGFARAKSGLFIGIGTIALVVGFIAGDVIPLYLYIMV